MAAAEDDNSKQNPSGSEAPRLSDLLDRGWKLFEEVDTTNEPSSSTAVQVKVKRAIMQLEEATRMVNQLVLFSHNEALEEISTADLKYLLLPALLGALTMKQVNPSKRLEYMQAARIYFMDFLQRCKDYDVCSFQLPRASENTADTPPEEQTNPAVLMPASQPDLIAMATQRQAKIERFMQRKETEAKLSEIRGLVESGLADEEVVREFYLLHVRRWITLAIEEIDSINQEMEILKRMELFKQSAPQPSPPKRPPMKPFILTKDAVQAKVFGAGYPSLSTMTVDEWYDQHQRQGCLPDQGIPRSADVDIEEDERAERERKEENDDEEALQKARDWDDWKDTHRRGYGNRKNMG
ncbi:immunoglobulin-binding protein 1 isoform X2 [Carassius carassius]|uniref:immunoglobulin-binding protein 1 isoform X2 n=1 Tax=Carassius carassius TaxID=217509 RepID=UPI002868E331|nr:immunoglobulin-binding protein 1 isoform X2 [Carassius carassius]